MFNLGIAGYVAAVNPTIKVVKSRLSLSLPALQGEWGDFLGLTLHRTGSGGVLFVQSTPHPPKRNYFKY